NNSTWAPDANNRVWIWLVADNGDLSIANGYALTFDNNITTNGELALVRMDNGSAGAVLNSTNYTWTAGSTVGFEVIHTETNTWYIKVDNDGGFDMLLTLSGCPTDNTYSTGTHMGIYFEYDATACDDLQFDDFTMTQCGTPASYYSVDSGVASGAVWNTDPSAGIGNGYEVIFNPYKEAFITNSQTVTLDTDVSMMNLQIGHGTYGEGTLNVSASEAIMLTGNWTNNANFSAATGSVIFKGTAATQSLGGTAASDFYNVEVNKEAGSVVQANTVTIHGALYPELGTYDINSQPFTLLSDANGTGAIAEIKTGADVTGGTITLQRYIAPGSQQTWMNLGNGLMNTTISDWDNEITTTGFTGADYEYADYPFINVYHYDESASGDLDQGFTAPVNTAEALDHQFGYLVYLETAAQNIDATGDFQKGDVTLNLNFTSNNGLTDDGWNLVSNVYPSAISWTDVYNASSGIGSTYYVHDGDGFNGTRNYIFYDAVSGTGTASEVIASGQSFWVKVDGAGGTLNFNEASKTQAASLFERQLLELPVLGMKVTSASSSDYCYIVLDENMSHTFDSNRDALHLGGNSMNQSVGLSTQSADEMFLSVNNIPGFEEVTTIPVQFKSPVAQNMTFEITDWDEIPEGVCLVIEDLTNGQMTVLDQDTNFEFAAEAEDGIRFLIHVSGPAQMDVSPLACYGDDNASITANASGEGVFTYTWIDELDNVVAIHEDVESSTIENLAFGNYTVVITGENTLCPATSQSVYIDQPTQETAQASGLTAWCNEEGSGIITIATNADVYNYSILDANNTLILSETLVSGESMVAGLDGQVYSVELNSVCSAFTYTIDLADANAINAAIEPNVATGVLINGQATVEFDANASNADNFAWTVNGTAVSGTDIMQYTFESAGVYTVAVIAENAACSAQHSIEFTVEEFNAVEENEEQITVIQMTDYLQLQGGAAMRGAMVYVYGTAGQLVKQERISDENATIYTADLAAGSYRMVVRNGQSELLNHAFVQGK
ncbi:MAG: hypothetical protein KDC12_01645, partial [Flavobacteriales bacterium]|nr:hypothetical protein [Flavobacteriales bacterium]